MILSSCHALDFSVLHIIINFLASGWLISIGYGCSHDCHCIESLGIEKKHDGRREGSIDHTTKLPDLEGSV